MKDFLGRELSPGDEIVYVTRCGHRAELRSGTVARLSSQFVFLTEGTRCKVTPAKVILKDAVRAA